MPFQCSGCDEKFAKRTTFDTHRVGPWGDPIYKSPTNKTLIGYTKPERRCLSLQEMTEKGMKKNEKGLWLSGIEFPTGRFQDGGKGPESDDDEEEEEQNGGGVEE